MCFTILLLNCVLLYFVDQSGGKSIDGNCSGSSDMDTSSDASLTKFKSNDDNVKSSSPNAKGSKDNADSSSSKLPEFATTDDDLKGILFIN